MPYNFLCHLLSSLHGICIFYWGIKWCDADHVVSGYFRQPRVWVVYNKYIYIYANENFFKIVEWYDLLWSWSCPSPQKCHNSTTKQHRNDGISNITIWWRHHLLIKQKFVGEELKSKILISKSSANRNNSYLPLPNRCIQERQRSASLKYRWQSRQLYYLGCKKFWHQDRWRFQWVSSIHRAQRLR